MSLLKEYDPQLFILRNCIRNFGLQSQDFQECEHARWWLYKSLDLEDVPAALGWADGLRIALLAAKKPVEATVEKLTIVDRAQRELEVIVNGLRKLRKSR